MHPTWHVLTFHPKIPTQPNVTWPFGLFCLIQNTLKRDWVPDQPHSKPLNPTPLPNSSVCGAVLAPFDWSSQGQHRGDWLPHLQRPGQLIQHTLSVIHPYHPRTSSADRAYKIAQRADRCWLLSGGESTFHSFEEWDQPFSDHRIFLDRDRVEPNPGIPG